MEKIFLSEEEYHRKQKEIANQIGEAYSLILSNSSTRIPLGLALSAAAFSFCHLYETAFSSASASVVEGNLPEFIELMETVRNIISSSTDISKNEIERQLMKRLNKEND